ncbi:LrgB family protein [Glaciecola sp. KUL10]|uniref:LrgB family protein n=1 Tax=Glaciecola sp. (strain KUL10) TaxID=2161813 RepID=UPI000D78651C|nr:LrgB family protein [Glaciecola sp. KUL10]GBL04828.1 LrgB-like protein [Glaciecola sp. KUL10]
MMSNIGFSVVLTGLTILVYYCSRRVFFAYSQAPLLNPLFMSSIFIGTALIIIDMSVFDYHEHVTLLEILIWPATAALAIPLYSQLSTIRQMGWRVVFPVVIAGVIAPLSAWLFVFWLDAPLDLQMTVLVKSITTPLAMQTTELVGGLPELAAIIVILTGIVGASVAPFLFAAFHIKSSVTKGLTLGAIAHVVGTSSALNIDKRCGAFASLALCLNGIVTSICLPLLFT